ncbi:MAG: lasso RiPP family leader peptide-containing protein [Acidimicrobiales bacterium]
MCPRTKNGETPITADEKYEVPAVYEPPTITVLGEVTDLTQMPEKFGSVADLTFPGDHHHRGS